MDLVRSIGADHVADYTQEDSAKSGQRYDLILDNAGNHSLSEFRRMLTTEGTFIANSGASMGLTGMARALSPFVRQRLGSFFAKLNHDDLVVLLTPPPRAAFKFTPGGPRGGRDRANPGPEPPPSMAAG